jgi:2-phospho-L-lactate guanylyltransferase
LSGASAARLWAAVPFRGLADPKRRLASLLSLPERQALARAMLTDVLRAIQAAGLFERVLLVSREPAALELASELGAEPLEERGRTGYRAAAAQAAAVALAAGAEALVVLPADLPLLAAGDLKELVAVSRRAAVVLAPAAAGGGTNAMLTRPPGAIPFRYGRGSLEAHWLEARQRRLRCGFCLAPGLALDVDRPVDLRAVLEFGGRSAVETRRYLRESGVAARLAATGRAGRSRRAASSRAAAARGPDSRA